MKLPTVRTFALLGVCLAGCGRSSIPSDSFRLTAANVFMDEVQRVWHITIESSDTNGCSVCYSNRLGKGSTWAALQHPSNGLTHAEVWLAASRVPVTGAPYDLVQTIIRSGRGENTVLQEVPRGTPLTNTVALTIHDGIYRLNEPLVIGRMYDGDVTLTVGKTSNTRTGK